jgi:hypothetical protein
MHDQAKKGFINFKLMPSQDVASSGKALQSTEPSEASNA